MLLEEEDLPELLAQPMDEAQSWPQLGPVAWAHVGLAAVAEHRAVPKERVTEELGGVGEERLEHTRVRVDIVERDRRCSQRLEAVVT